MLVFWHNADLNVQCKQVKRNAYPPALLIFSSKELSHNQVLLALTTKNISANHNLWYIWNVLQNTFL